MEWIALLSRLLLAGVFLVAAIGKLADREGSRRAVADFGVPRDVSGPIALLLPCAEIAVATLLFFGGSARIGALAALALLGIFTATIAVTLARGRKPDCHCFGQLRPTPIGTSTLVRNGVLLGLAGLAFWQGGRSPHAGALAGGAGYGPVTWMALAIAVVALVVAAAEGWLLLGLLPQQGRLLHRVEELELALGKVPFSGRPIGEQAPEFELRDLGGDRVTLGSLRALGRPVLLFFTNPHCGPCDELLPRVAQWQRDEAERIRIAIIARDSVEVNRAKAAQHGLRTVLLQRKREVSEDYQVESTPAAVLVGADGSIASPIAYGPERIGELVRGAVDPSASLARTNGSHHGGHSHTESSAVGVGQTAPALTLPDLEGNTTTLSELGGAPTLLLFWNPDCGFCQQLLPELKAWERRRADQTPQLLVVSRGDVAANRAMGLSSRVVLDDDGSAMRAFGVKGTPMGVLVDHGGKIASTIVAGGPQVMALARTQQQIKAGRR